MESGTNEQTRVHSERVTESEREVGKNSMRKPWDGRRVRFGAGAPPGRESRVGGRYNEQKKKKRKDSDGQHRAHVGLNPPPSVMRC